MFHSISNSGVPGPTTRIVVGDVVDTFEDEFTNSNGAPAIGALVTCESGDVRFTLGGNIVTPTYPPTQGAAGLGHVLFANQSLALASGRQVRTFQFIAYTNKVAAVLQVTPFFEIGA
jgi:hypothetical protein